VSRKFLVNDRVGEAARMRVRLQCADRSIQPVGGPLSQNSIHGLTGAGPQDRIAQPLGQACLDGNEDLNGLGVRHGPALYRARSTRFQRHHRISPAIGLDASAL
jgi:hypothetical protein